MQNHSGGDTDSVALDMASFFPPPPGISVSATTLSQGNPTLNKSNTSNVY